MDDVPPPSERRILLTGVIVTAVALVGVLLFGGYLPGLKPDFSNPATLEFNGHAYYYDEYTYAVPLWPANATSPSPVEFHNHTFAIWVTAWYTAGVGVVRGNVSETNGSHFQFALGGPPALPERENLSLSPDGEVGAYWDGLATYVNLLVLANATG